MHQVRPVTRGERLACFFWIESMVRSEEHRRMLFDLDMAILALRQKHGDNDETVQLTGRTQPVAALGQHLSRKPRLRLLAAKTSKKINPTIE